MGSGAPSWVACACAVLAGALWPSIARAEDASSAQALFEEGRSLMVSGNYADACPKLAASQRLDPGAGTLMNLATCYERRGQIASAWAAFKEAASASRSSGHPDWERAARERASKLLPELSRLTVIVPADSDVAGLTIERDGRVVDRAEWGAAIPVDGGVHVLRAVAPHRHAWSTEITIAQRASQASVTVPMLVDESASPERPAALPASVDDTRASRGTSRRLIGLSVAGAGVVGLGLGGVFALLAKATHDDALTHCSPSRVCTARGIELGDKADGQAMVSTVAFVAGGVFLVGGAALYLTAPSAQRTGSSVWVSPSLGGASLGGAF